MIHNGLSFVAGRGHVMTPLMPLSWRRWPGGVSISLNVKADKTTKGKGNILILEVKNKKKQCIIGKH